MMAKKDLISKPKHLWEYVEILETDELSKRLHEQELLDSDCDWTQDPTEN